MITLHHLNNSRSQRVLWMLEELGVPYELKHYQRHPKTMLAPPSLKEVHPLGKSPVLTDGEQTIAESAAILEYLLDRYGDSRMRPAVGTPEYLRYRFFMHYPESSLMPLMLLTLVFSRMPKEPMPFFVRPVAEAIAKNARTKFIGPQVKTHLDYLEGELAGRTWILGDELTAADMQMSFPLEAAASRAGLTGKYPHLARYLSTIRERPAYQRALQKGGPFHLG